GGGERGWGGGHEHGSLLVRPLRSARDRDPVTGSVDAVEYEYQGPTAGADRAVLLAHGAGADRRTPALVAVADELEAVGIPSLRFDYPYRGAGRRAPDRAPVLDRATRDAIAELAARSGVSATRLVLGGRSMGG